MMEFLKVLILIVILLVMAYPLLPFSSKAKKFSTFRGLRYDYPNHGKNIVYLLVVVLLFAIVAVAFGLFDELANVLYSVPFITKILSNASNATASTTEFIIFVIKVVVINVAMLYGFVFVKGLLKKTMFDPIFGIKKVKKKKDKDKDKNVTSIDDDDKKDDKAGEDDLSKKRKFRRVPFFRHSDKEEEIEEVVDTTDDEKKPRKKHIGKGKRKFLGIFFEGDELQYARRWVVRSRSVLQFFIYMVEVLYFLLFTCVLLSVLFPMPEWIYTFLLDTLGVETWYIYPFISLIFLQEICNTFNAPPMDVDEKESEEEKKEKKDQAKVEANLRALQSELKKRFDKDHSLRYYPEVKSEKPQEYVCTNIAYESALKYIRSQMEVTSGRVVEGYMECLDAIYNDNHVYFAASFYSELGEYLIAYTYVRLLSGARMMFVVSNEEEKKTLKKYVSERLMKMTHSSENCTWRVYTSEERIDQADVFIASPADFFDDNVVGQYPSFFEEVSNAIFIDADRMITFDSYLCMVLSSRLQKATNNRIKFVFLSLNLLKGFATGSLPKFFGVDKVLSFSSAKENEAVSYTLWNKESKNNRIYNKNGQTLTSLECIIAEQACLHGVDGVRLITETPMDRADKKMLALHNVEINNLYRDIADVNYMIYSDERCNLAAALYACTRFRGRKKSLVHIVSKPYLLREYFMTKAITEDYINRSSFIQPRVTEHAERHKLSLLRVYCDATTGNGIKVSEFVERVKMSINVALERHDYRSSKYCKNLVKTASDIDGLNYRELAAYLLAGLYDKPDCEIADSIAKKAKDYYIIVDPSKQDGYTLQNEKYIVFNRVKEIFDRLFECNTRVQLKLNDAIVGTLDTFPDRVRLEYIAGQSIIHNNAEYEIEYIASNDKTIYLRRENTGIKNCLDTVLLRRYGIKDKKAIGSTGVLHYTQTQLEEIRVKKYLADVDAETYGFYSLMTDRQTLDFYRGVEGNPHVAERDKNVRNINQGKIVNVSLIARQECTDGMRMLLSAVMNEFIRTIFPNTYHCIAICPVLENPLEFNDSVEPLTEIDQIRALYPYFKGADGEFKETDKNRMQFYIINDCYEDVGALDWFYDQSARYMQEFIANVYSYLYWLKVHKDKQHYIYFGGKELPECYDLEGCCELFKDFNMILSDDGKQDYYTASDDEKAEETVRCSFCHRIMESGRYSLFDNNRFICVDCFDVVDNKDRADEIYQDVRDYLHENYPQTTFGKANVEIDGVYELKKDEVLSEHYYRVDDQRNILIERDTPETNAAVSILRGLVDLWQRDNDLVIPYANAQLYYEELQYLKHLGKTESADWILGALDGNIRAQIEEIEEYVDTGKLRGEVEEETPEEENDDTVDIPEENGDDDIPVTPDTGKFTSFMFIREKALELDKLDDYDDDVVDGEDDDSSDALYNPNNVPRFWKRFLMGMDIDDGKDEKVSDDDIDDGLPQNAVRPRVMENAPYDDFESDDLDQNDEITDDEVVDDMPIDDTDETKKKKGGFFSRLFKKKKKDETPVDDIEKDDLDVSDTEDDKEVDDTTDDTDESKKKGGFFSKLFKKKKKDQTPVDDTDETPVDDTDDNDQKKKKKEKPPKRRKVRKGATPGEAILPHEDEEDSNPKIRFYNELVRACFNYTEKPIKAEGLSTIDVERIFTYVRCDYPELFWLYWYKRVSDDCYAPIFRCRKANGEFDAKQVDQKRIALRKAAKKFTRGISRKTDPYKALLTIYRRLILALDYDGKGLDAHVDRDIHKDDQLRSLYSALVEHKVVCAGYATAMQYLLQSVGIVCGYTISECDASGNSCHAFNIVKIGKYVYYLDATWGDASNTKTGEDFKNLVKYEFCCVPYSEFTAVSKESLPFHVPRKEYYPTLKQFKYTNHEYYRYHKAFLSRYNEDELARIFVETAVRHNEKEMGEFVITFRCIDVNLARYIYSRLHEKSEIWKIAKNAKEILARKNKSLAKLITDKYSIWQPSETGVIQIKFVD